MKSKIGTRIATLRKSRGLSQKEAAAALGVSQGLLSHYENGIRECGLEFLGKLADYFEVSTDYLLGRSGKEGGDLHTASAALEHFLTAVDAMNDAASADALRKAAVCGVYSLIRTVDTAQDYTFAPHQGPLASAAATVALGRVEAKIAVPGEAVKRLIQDAEKMMKK